MGRADALRSQRWYWAGLKEVDRVFSEAFRRIGNTIKDAFLGVFDFITGTTAYKSLSGFIGKAIDWVSNTIGADGQSAVASSLPSNYPESSYSPSYFPASSTTNNSNVNAPRSVSISAPINVSVPPGTNHDEIGPRVQAGIKDAFNEILRQSYTPAWEEW